MKADRPVRRAVLEKPCPHWPPWLQASRFARCLGHTAPPAGDFVANSCFGRLAERERLALEGLIAGDRYPAQPVAAEPPDRDPTGRVD